MRSCSRPLDPSPEFLLALAKPIISPYFLTSLSALSFFFFQSDHHKVLSVPLEECRWTTYLLHHKHKTGCYFISWTYVAVPE